jgi:hypothetical protein
MNGPEQKEGVCPWCETTARLRLTRQDGDAAEYRCGRCDMPHVRKAGDADYFAFFPADIAAAFNCDAPPLEIVTG